MSEESPRGFDWPTRSWFLWGVIAVLVLVAVILFVVNLGSGPDDDDTASTAEQVEWTIDVSDYAPTPGEVTLKGDKPLGFPTETWRDGVMLLRSVDAGQFEWKMDVSPEVPVPVHEIDQADGCEALQALLDRWVQQVGDAGGDGEQTQAAAFAQHAANTMIDQGCEISLDQ